MRNYVINNAKLCHKKLKNGRSGVFENFHSKIASVVCLPWSRVINTTSRLGASKYPLLTEVAKLNLLLLTKGSTNSKVYL